MLDRAVTAILRSDKVQRINFTVEGVRVDGSGFTAVADAVQRGAIQVYTNTQLNGMARYRYRVGPNRVNVLEVPFAGWPGHPQRALVVHEAVHAMNDWRGRSVNSLADESAAYIAQWIYLIWGGSRPSMGSDEQAMVEMFAFSIAEGLRRGTPPDRRSLEQLRDAILAMPAYRNLNREGFRERAYDGLSR